MREVQINSRLKLREDGKLFVIKTGEEFIPKSKNSKGYLVVRCKQYNDYMPGIHLLVMKFFGPEKPGIDYQVDHIDRNILNNDIKNLRWVTPSENCHNRSNNRPLGHRKCDFADIKEYNRDRCKGRSRADYMREYRARKKAKDKP
jgi:hypothetical protein